jgi:hypothetical protein
MKMASDWSTLPQAGKWRSKVRTSYTNESTSNAKVCRETVHQPTIGKHSLFFNVVLEVIVRRTNIQASGTIYNKETQLLAYANDIDIVGRSQSAVRDAYLALEGEAVNVRLK